MNLLSSKYPIHNPATIVTGWVQNKSNKDRRYKFVANLRNQKPSFLKISIFLFLLACGTTIHTYSQDIIPLLENGNKWSVKSTEEPHGPLHPTQTIKTTWYKVGGDTTFNEKDYKLILESNDSLATKWDFAFMMREDSGKVFYYPYGNEELLYDFGLEINDSIVSYFGSSYRVSKLISKIDTLFGNKVRKKYHFTNYWPGFKITLPEIWFEGIGSILGLQRSSCFGFTGCYIVEDLSCFYQNDTLIYQSCPTCRCYMLVTSVDKIAGIKDLKVVPNPASDVLEITSPSILSGYEIFNQYGVLIKKDNINANRKTIDISGLLTGIYIIKVYDTNKHFTSTKIIIQ